jgi:uncharacterized membrane protein
MTDKLIMGLGILVFIIGITMIATSQGPPTSCPNLTSTSNYYSTYDCIASHMSIGTAGFVVILMGVITAIIGMRLKRD